MSWSDVEDALKPLHGLSVRRLLQGDGENEIGIETDHLGHRFPTMLQKSCTAER